MIEGSFKYWKGSEKDYFRLQISKGHLSLEVFGLELTLSWGSK